MKMCSKRDSLEANWDTKWDTHSSGQFSNNFQNLTYDPVIMVYGIFPKGDEKSCLHNNMHKDDPGA